MTFAEHHIINRNTQPLTIDQIARYAPSALAIAPGADRSARYAYIPTIDVIKGMEKAGFLPFSATQSRSRVEEHKKFTKHMIRFRHVSSVESLAEVGNCLPEVVLINSHDGTSAYKLLLGIFRFVCSNGMVVADSMQGSVSVRHQGNIIDAVVEASAGIVQKAPLVLDAVKRWGSLLLTDGEQNAFATAAHNLRFADEDGNADTPIQPAQLLQPRRREDAGSDLWSVFNRVQEHVIKGGDRGYKVEGEDSPRRVRRVTTRGVKGIDQDVKLNRALWLLAEKMAELKTA
jgi:hypothetical protein